MSLKYIQIDSVKNVIKNWKKQYPVLMCLTDSPYKNSEDVLIALSLLPSNVSRQEIDKCIGNSEWTEELCYSCKEFVTEGMVSDNNNYYCFICLDCLKEASEYVAENSKSLQGS